MEVEELNVSEVGTKSYWSDVYEKELTNFYENEDPGEEWFGRSATNRVVHWILKNNISPKASVLDIGCGNGLLLLQLVKHGFENVTGIDYCKDALELAKEVFKSEGLNGKTISWLSLDITSETIMDSTTNDKLLTLPIASTAPSGYTQKTFNVCTDKGTYDAVSLNPNDSHHKRMEYIKNLKRHLSNSGLFIIVSCNWTCSELKYHFSDFEFIEEIPAPTLTFGGKQGQTVSTCVFRLT